VDILYIIYPILCSAYLDRGSSYIVAAAAEDVEKMYNVQYFQILQS